MNQAYNLQDTVNVVCDFLEIAPTIVEKNDSVDSLTDRIKDASSFSPFARKMDALSRVYNPLKLNNLLDAAINGQSSESTLRSLYHIDIKKFDELLGSLTKDYCANNCNQGTYRCCSGPYTFKFKFEDLEVLKIQEKESGICDDYSDEVFEIPGCKYLTDKGCNLKVSKTPLCLGFICPPLGQYIKEIAPINSDAFIKELKALRNIDGVTVEAISVLDKVTTLGKLVLEEKNSKI